jgi:hypothetical protein
MAEPSSTAWSVYQRGDTGAWMLRFKDPVTAKWRDKRIPASANVTTKRLAEAWTREWLRERAEAATDSSSTTLTLAHFLNRWLEQRATNPKIRSSTLRNRAAASGEAP